MIISPRHLLATAIADRDSFDTIKQDGEFSNFQDISAIVWNELSEYYERDKDAKSADTGLLERAITERLANPKHSTGVTRFLAGLQDVSVPNIRVALGVAKRRRIGDSLSSALAARRPDSEIEGLIQQYTEACQQAAKTAEGEDEGPVTWEGLIKARRSTATRIAVSPKALNERLGGGLLPGHNVTIFARPEAGKTATLVSMACGFARRGVKVLYLVNEDPAADIAVRVMANLSNMTAVEMDADPVRAEQEAIKRGVLNLLLIDLVPSTLGEIDRLARLYEPQVLIIDQLRNVTIPGKADNYTQTLDKVAQGIRNIGKSHNIITIGTTQAGDSAERKLVLDMSDIDSSKTGIPAAADLLIGIGNTDTLERAGQRMLSICKNKITGVKDAFTVGLDTARSKMTSI